MMSYSCSRVKCLRNDWVNEQKQTINTNVLCMLVILSKVTLHKMLPLTCITPAANAVAMMRFFINNKLCL